jgi:putative copper resistance protein D
MVPVLVAAVQAIDGIDMGNMQHGDESDFITMFQFLFISRWVHFASVFVLFGSSFFWFYTGCEQLPSGHSERPKALRMTIAMLRIAAPVAMISGVAWLAGILANMTGGFRNALDPETLRLFFFETAFGPVSALRLALLAAAVVIVCLPWPNRAWLPALLHIGALLLISQAWLGHAAEGGAGLYGAAMIIAYGVHMLAAGAWVGGLPPLLFVLAEKEDPGALEARRTAVNILLRYSSMGLIAVTLIVLSGIANAGFRVAGSFARLFDTGYGNMLVAKLALVAVMLALAYYNRFVMMPGLDTTSPKAETRITKLSVSIGFELAVAVFVLGAASALGITPPPQ